MAINIEMEGILRDRIRSCKYPFFMDSSVLLFLYTEIQVTAALTVQKKATGKDQEQALVTKGVVPKAGLTSHMKNLPGTIHTVPIVLVRIPGTSAT